MKSIAEGTLKQYNKAVKLWWIFCQKNRCDLFNCSTPELLQFFSKTVENVKSYSTLNVYRSALSLLMGNELGKNVTISRFFKGVANLKPSQPKYNTTWDPKPVLEHLSTLYPHHQLSLEKITKKLVTILALCTA